MGDRLGRELPPGLTLLAAEPLDPRAPSISEALRAVHYRAEFPGRSGALPDDGARAEPEQFPEHSCGEGELRARVEAFLGAEEAKVTRASSPQNRSRGRHQKVAARKEREIDLKRLVTHLSVEGPGVVAFSLRADPTGSAKPAEVLAAIFGDGTAPAGVKVLKEGVSFDRSGQSRQEGQPRTPRYLDA